MSKKTKKAVTQDLVRNQIFTFRKANVALSFTLRVDIKQELEDFLELLETATVQVKKEIENVETGQ
jgi:hypothetical protein